MSLIPLPDNCIQGHKEIVALEGSKLTAIYFHTENIHIQEFKAGAVVQRALGLHRVQAWEPPTGPCLLVNASTLEHETVELLDLARLNVIGRDRYDALFRSRKEAEDWGVFLKLSLGDDYETTMSRTWSSRNAFQYINPSVLPD